MVWWQLYSSSRRHCSNGSIQIEPAVRLLGAAITGRGVYCWGEDATQAREEPGSPLGHLWVIGDGRWQGDLILGGSKGAW